MLTFGIAKPDIRSVLTFAWTTSPSSFKHRSSHAFVLKTDVFIYRRLARRGGVKRISAAIYEDIRYALKEHLTKVRLLLKLIAS